MVRMLIGGELVQGSRMLDVVDPCTGAAFTQVPDADAADVDSAVAAAKAAYPAWRELAPSARGDVLRAMAAKIAENADELCALLVRETGRPMGLAQFEILHLATSYIGYYAGLEVEPELIVEDDTRRVELHRKSLGVVGAIVPWNAPIYIACSKIGPALAAGNTIVVKTAPTTPLTTLRLGELWAEVVPAGVVNILSGGNDAGALLVAHEDVAKISFTGSTETGRKIMAAAATTLKRVTLELGGNDAAIVLPDADIAAVAPAVFAFAFFNSGQVCAVIKRLYVHDSIYDEMCDAIAALARGAKVAPGSDASAEFGPVQNKAQYEKVLHYLGEAKAAGKIIAGGDAADGAGYFVPLTVVRDVSDGAAIVDEEPFGPILPIIRYSDVDDAVARANASPFALGGSVWGSDVEAAAKVAARLESGSVWVNQHCALDPQVPFPANKQSGFGVEGGVEGLYPYLALQTINVAKPVSAA
ncbi:MULTISPECIES: aldehyde dehydrogenase family protein [unclassified Sphingopyxis]|uniref:aldehyde dehydrogenase family protein n=1 Tax=unclassified Sphingopyxis TaxID=2614943 RepID=UPI002863432F|nr:MULTISPECIES: aldehyde dehydrogenase family protein [unclassified Sphingopyxis]MDR6832573.1 acyl-CoA reductase-like NAD-dependent aldehyde dehydrogenase [Sphingopyxis sp. BE122]MDR7228316.1 acyl-CoA reductase-like NAD-dependent aldehyde dehydrogenase [Sphingopyxis sp. BE259]